MNFKPTPEQIAKWKGWAQGGAEPPVQSNHILRSSFACPACGGHNSTYLHCVRDTPEHDKFECKACGYYGKPPVLP